MRITIDIPSYHELDSGHIVPDILIAQDDGGKNTVGLQLNHDSELYTVSSLLETDLEQFNSETEFDLNTALLEALYLLGVTP